jgi:hypothetical protein
MKKPYPNQTITLCGQGAQLDFTVEAQNINGDLMIPTPEGPVYVNREQAKDFFGLVEHEGGWVVAKQVAVETGGSKPELAYQVFDGAPVFDSFDSCSSAIEGAGFSLGWVAIETHRLNLRVKSCTGSKTQAGCNYMATCGRVCNKCGKVHDGSSDVREQSNKA